MTKSKAKLNTGNQKANEAIASYTCILIYPPKCAPSATCPNSENGGTSFQLLLKMKTLESLLTAISDTTYPIHQGILSALPPTLTLSCHLDANATSQPPLPGIAATASQLDPQLLPFSLLTTNKSIF